MVAVWRVTVFSFTLNSIEPHGLLWMALPPQVLMKSLKEKYRCTASFCVDFGGEYFIPFPFSGCLQTALITPMQHA